MFEQRRLETRDLPAAADVLARAFCENPAMVGIIGRESAARLAVLRVFMETTARLYVSRGECWGAFEDGALRAAMMTLPPGGYPLPLQSDLALFWMALRNGGLAATVRFARADVLLRKYHTRTEHHYLFLLGTDPDFQGKGFGSRLLQGLSDHAGPRACYLETDRPSSVKLYERHGYRVVHHQQAPLGERAFPLWFMLREPAGDAG